MGLLANACNCAYRAKYAVVESIIREADKRWLHILFGEPYEAKFQSREVHVYGGNGDEILTYIADMGWHVKKSKAEMEVHVVFWRLPTMWLSRLQRKRLLLNYIFADKWQVFHMV